jgi:hypothetical protein
MLWTIHPIDKSFENTFSKRNEKSQFDNANFFAWLGAVVVRCRSCEGDTVVAVPANESVGAAAFPATAIAAAP